MTMGPTAPEPASEGKDLSGGFIELRYSNAQDSHKLRVHVSPFTNSSGSLLYVTPPSGLFSDAGPDVTAGLLIATLQQFFTSDWTIALDSIWQMLSGQPQQVFPTPVVASAAGTGTALTDRVYSRAGQFTFNTRDTSGAPFRLCLLGSWEWAPYGRQVFAANNAGTREEKLVYFLTNNGAIRSHAGNKPLAPMTRTCALNNRLRRAYHQR